MNSIGYSDQQSSAAYRAAVMSGATGQVEGYTAAPASDQQQQQQQGDDVGYDYGQPSHADPRRGRYGEAFAMQQQQNAGYSSQSKKAIVIDPTRLTGRCLWFDARKNYGAIQPDHSLGIEGETGHSYIFVHGNDLEPGSSQLRQGDVVEFCRGTCPRGRPKAAKVTIVASAAQGGGGSGQYVGYANGHIPGSQAAQRAQQQQQLWSPQQVVSTPGPAQSSGVVGSPGQQQQQPTNGQVGGPGSQQSIGVQPQQAAYAVQPGGYPGASQQAYAGHTSYQQYAQQGAATYAMNGGAGGRVRGPASAAAAAAAAGYAAYAQQPRQLGRVKWFDRDRKQYGFITPADGSPDLFMHAGDVLGSTKLLGPGDPVEFDYGVQTQSGRPKALEVARLVQHLGDEEEDDGRTTIGKFASGDEPLFDGARVTGTIARFDQQHRWGFIAPDNETLKPPNGGDNFFVHGLDVLDISDSNPVEVGQAVEFSVVKNRVRKYKAVQCLRVNADAREDSHPATATGTEGESAEGGEQTATAETTAENDDDDEAAATATPPASPSRAAAAAAETANAKKNSPQEQQATADDATTTTNNNSEDSIKDSNEASGDGAGAAETVVVAE